MFDAVQSAWLRLLRVPPEPVAPPGEESVRSFRAAPRFYTWRRIKWAGSQIIALGGIIVANLAIDGDAAPQGVLGTILGALVWVAWSVQFLITFAVMRLDYELRWYILTDRSLRIREGVLRVTEKTMTYANIQHLSVRQGPLQRLLGIADLQVRTAGGGSSAAGQGGQGGAGESTHIAYFRGVDRPEEIRSLIRDRIRLYQDAGLGDPDDIATPAAPDSAASTALLEYDARDLLQAARTLSAEARALRERLATRG